MELGEKTVYTPEQVAITYTLAGVGTRFAAIAIDSLLQAALMAIVVIIFGLLTFGVASLLDRLNQAAEDPVMALAGALWLCLLILLMFVLYWGYFVFWETIWSGQTPGKRVCGIRVLRDGGFPIDFRAALIRNLLRAADVLPGMYGVGLLTMLFSADSKRLGDFAAGTIVVADARQSDLRRAATGAAPPPPTVEYQLLGDPALLNLRALTREQFSVVDRFVARQAELPEAVRDDLARQIALPLMPLIGFTPPDGAVPHARFLVELAIAYRSLAGA